MKKRYFILILLTLLSVITYLDRLCIAVAGPSMQQDLGLSPEQWGWVMGAFALTYALVRDSQRRVGDSFGRKKVLARIVIWWSCFTGLTGLTNRFGTLVAVRALFGMGEAGRIRISPGVSPGGFPRRNGRGHKASCGAPAGSVEPWRRCWWFL